MDHLREIFGRIGLRCTKQRERIYHALAMTTEHPTAEELHGIVRAAHPGLSLATVYNTLEVFTKHGLCRKLPSANGACRYDADLSQHVHLTTPDGQVIDLPDDLSRQILSRVKPEDLHEIERRTGMHVSRVNVQVIVEPDA